MSTENFTSEQAQTLLEESFKSIQKQEPAPTIQPVVPAEVPAQPEPVAVEPAPAAEPVAPAAEPANPTPSAPEPEAPAPAASAPTADDPYAWVEKIPEEFRDKVVSEIKERFRFEHQSRSDAGRVKALQRKILEQEQRAAQSKPATQTPAPAERQPTTPESWQALAKADPEIAEAIEARVKSEIEAAVGSVRNELQEMKQTAVDPLYERQIAEYREAQFAELKNVVPNVEQVINSREYMSWLNNDATDTMRNLAQNSVEWRDAVVVLQAYANDMIRMGYAQAPNAPAAAPSPSQPAAPGKADEIAVQRQRQLQAPAPRTTVSPTPAGNPNLNGPMTKDDQEAYFQQMMAKLLKKT